MSDNPEAPTLGQIAYKGFDDYWHEGSRGIDAEAWEASAQAVRAALAQQAATPPASVRERSPWEALFWTVAKELNCLPSSFVDANDHVIRKAREYAAAAAQQAATPAPAEPVARLSDDAILRIARGVIEQECDETKPAVEQFAVGIARAVEAALAAPPATPAAQPADEREAFEAWVSGTGRKHLLKPHSNLPGYEDGHIHTLWTAWQARAALGSQG